LTSSSYCAEKQNWAVSSCSHEIMTYCEYKIGKLVVDSTRMLELLEWEKMEMKVLKKYDKEEINSIYTKGNILLQTKFMWQSSFLKLVAKVKKLMPDNVCMTSQSHEKEITAGIFCISYKVVKRNWLFNNFGD
jgi:hypothetical protein